MKRFLIIFATITTVIFGAQGYCTSCEDYQMSMCPSIQEVNGPISSTLSKITGMNALIANTLESQIKKQMNEALDANFDLKIDSFGARSMLQGKFRGFSAHSDYANLGGFYVSNVTAESLCGYNHFVYKKGEVYTNENFLLSFSADVTSEDLQKTMNTPQYARLINSLNVNIGNIPIFKVFGAKAEINNDRLIFSLKILSPFTMRQAKQISINMGMSAENGKILFTDMIVNPKSMTANLESLLPIINKLNPLAFNTAIINNEKSMIKIQDINFIDNKIIIKGLVIVPKNYYNN